MLILGTQNFLFWPRVFSRALGCGARRGPDCTRYKCASRPGSVASALGVQSPQIWRVITGSLSAQPEQRRTLLLLPLLIVWVCGHCSSVYMCAVCVAGACAGLCIVCWQPTFFQLYHVASVSHRRPPSSQAMVSAIGNKRY